MCQKPIAFSRAIYVVLVTHKQTERLTVRCIQCAFHLLRQRRAERALLRTRCAATKRWVTLRWNGRWRAQPSSVRLLIAPETNGECLDRHLVFASEQVARQFLTRHPSLRTFSLLSLSDIAVRGKP